jgi:DNA-binding transcriptional LysR family regulator
VPLDLRITLHKLEIFNLVVELGGVGRAAERLFVSQPVVSGHLRSLEERLGAKLFYREGGHLHLTDEGRVAYAWAQDLLVRTREFDRELSGLKGGASGTIAFAASLSVGSYRLPAVLAHFRARHPGLDLRMTISDSDRVVEETRAGAFDFAVIAQFQGPLVDAERIGTDEIVLVTAPNGRPARSPIAVDELARLPIIEAPEGMLRRSFVDQQLQRAGVFERNVLLQLGHPEATKRATRAGHGASLILRSIVADELRAGTLREVRIDGVDFTVPIALVTRKGKALSSLHRQLLDEIRAALAPP